MRLAMAQMAMTDEIDENADKALAYCDQAGDAGADLVIIPTANITDEPLGMFLWEICVQAMQNQVAIAMCNRVGTEDDVTFAGQSVVVGPYGNVVSKADDQEQLIITDIDLTQTAMARKQRPFLKLRRPEWYA